MANTSSGMLKFSRTLSTALWTYFIGVNDTPGLTAINAGVLDMGTSTPLDPITGQANIYLVGQDWTCYQGGQAEHNYYANDGGIQVNAKGIWTMRGSPNKTPFVNLQAVSLDRQSITLASAPSGWAAGDRIIITATESGQLNQRQSPNEPIGCTDDSDLTEVATIGTISGTTITLPQGQSLQNDHRIKTPFVPRVGNLTRNVVIQSDNPLVPSHTLIAPNAGTIDLECGRFYALGAADFPTAPDGSGCSSRAATPKERYAIHSLQSGGSLMGLVFETPDQSPLPQAQRTQCGFGCGLVKRLGGNTTITGNIFYAPYPANASYPLSVAAELADSPTYSTDNVITGNLIIKDPPATLMPGQTTFPLKNQSGTVTISQNNLTIVTGNGTSWGTGAGCPTPTNPSDPCAQDTFTTDNNETYYIIQSVDYVNQRLTLTAA